MKKVIESTPPVGIRNYFSVKRKIRNKPFQNVTFTLRGRDAIAIAVKHFGLKKPDTVLLPGYLCTIIVDPFVNEFNSEYYDIEKDLSIDPEKIELILKSRQIKILYIIHYYGFLHKNLKELSQLCKKYNVLLWEDHAHSALSRISYEYADAIIFSFRKLYPIPDGGGLWMSNSPPLKFAQAKIFSSNLKKL